MKKKPGIQKALDFIAQGIAAKRFGDKLPPIVALAKAADVSYVTMWKAIELRKSQDPKADIPEQDSCTDISNPEEHNEQNIEFIGSPWQKMFTRFKQDILTGRFQAGQPLPSCKELQNLYEVSYPTLKKALSMLASQGIIKAFHRGFIVPALMKSESTVRIAAIGCGWEDGSLWIDHQDKNYFRILESECIQARIALDIVVYYHKDGKLHFIDTITRKPYTLTNDNILSFIYIVANLEIAPEEVLQKLLPLKKPIAVLDVVGGWEAAPRILNNYYLQMFTVTTSIQPPRRVAQYLLHHGHTNIAFISPFQKALWSIQRSEGIREVYRDAGLYENVHMFFLDDFAFQWDYLQENRDNPQDMQTLIDAYNKWHKYSNSKFFRKFGHIGYNISIYLSLWNCATGEIYHRMLPLFQKALADPSITAWVLANDYTATLALDFLKNNNKRVPEDISCISFDNTLYAMENHLTSFDFNQNGIVSLMLRYSLRPSSVTSSRKKTVLEVEGTIIERHSTIMLPRSGAHK